MSAKEFNKLSKEQLESKLKDYEESLVNYRFQKVLQQLENPFSIRFTKRSIAAINNTTASKTVPAAIIVKFGLILPISV